MSDVNNPSSKGPPAALQAARWRLILGDFAEDALPLDGDDQELNEALEFLYGREYGPGQGIRDDEGDGDGEGENGQGAAVGRRGGKGGSRLTIPGWIAKIQKLFPRRTVELMQKEALDRYHLTEILTDPEVLKTMEPNLDLLKNILTFKHIIPESVKSLAYQIVEKVIREIQKKLETQVRRTFLGKKLPNSSTSYKIFRNFDFKRTIGKNLKHYNAEYKTIVAERLYFTQNVRRYNPWNIIILVDESGSMLDSVIYSSVMASIFAKLPFLAVKLVIFDTSLVDLSDHIDDPVGILMKVQLGGGTDINGALEYAKKLITAPQKTMVVLVSDLYDGSDYRLMYKSSRDIIESGAKLFVLPALDYQASSVYDKNAALHFAKMGASVAAITPEDLAEWIGKVIS
ncbi:VWA domain-containing protein [Leadbettera azotonutricia]|uniref:CoxE family protein n=1 Tax=Leadbettera azotonutricia (strain ATCC BAA-888 / DSM 13862 / ZAS-9) TaxID=545695 RepID=F5Y9N5_LEAAZ|nr:VWA domain-containing protein [Leadbettera azotonutricia]AEF82880.1 CoxE family protein [Leadbettera azotonutricia ZAS-9]